MRFLILNIDAVIVFALSVVVLLWPQFFTKKDLATEENKALERKILRSGWLMLGGAFLIALARIGDWLG